MERPDHPVFSHVPQHTLLVVVSGHHDVEDVGGMIRSFGYFHQIRAYG
jgi:hypothetical protein